MSSIDRSGLSNLEERSCDLIAPVCERLTALSAEPALHARFLNTLSLMEHIGSRKIMASQGETGLSQDALKHLAEETRHAFFFKRAAEKLARRSLDYGADDTIAGSPARFYMGRLDAAIGAALPRERSSALPYLYMSLIVELRAIWFYRLYQSTLGKLRGVISLASVLAEEELHLSAMLARIETLDAAVPARIAQFSSYEDGRFRSLWTTIDSDCARYRLAAE